uniref:Secreted protein n=1 Tax=Panagrellus redivivus TaxID=6233 RepID=A0A7E4ZZG1_PANRE
MVALQSCVCLCVFAVICTLTVTEGKIVCSGRGENFQQRSLCPPNANHPAFPNFYNGDYKAMLQAIADSKLPVRNANPFAHARPDTSRLAYNDGYTYHDFMQHLMMKS